MFAATVAHAANAIVTTNVNLRSGPGTNYSVLTAVPNGSSVSVEGCTDGYGWCRVGYGQRSGWASSQFLAFHDRPGSNFGTAAAGIGIPLIAGMVIGSALHDNHRHHWHRPSRPGIHRPGLHRPGLHRPGLHRPHHVHRPHNRPHHARPHKQPRARLLRHR
ncbi:SH3 domain-containing protein [Mesorhizobium sp. VK25A]|nr:SH3 domain-containing protein [Mesorhizobium sp. VK25A]MDX8543432.1 SH3 domain-containing protein [Mesorhizobium sp. VK25A]